MNNNTGLSEKELSLIADTIHSVVPGACIKIFGSRAMDNFKPGSDIDIAIKDDNKISLRKLAMIKSKLEETNLPYFTDLLDYRSIKENDLKEHIDSYAVDIER